MNNTKSEGVKPHWDAVNVKLADPAFVLKCVNCHDDLLSACKDELYALRLWMRRSLPEDIIEGMELSADKMLRAIDKSQGKTL